MRYTGEETIPPQKEESSAPSFSEALAGPISVLVTGGFVWLCVATYNALFRTAFGLPVYRGVMVAVGLTAAGIAFYIWRDRKKSKVGAAAQVAIGTVAGTVATFAAPNLELQILAAAAAVVVIADGISKLSGN
jgi:hypothetical protein